MANRIDKDVEVTIVNNTHGSFSYNFKGTIIELDDFGDEDYLTFGELKTMSSSKHKSILRDLMILITEVDSDDFTVDDVIEQLKLTKYYKPLNNIVDDLSTESIEDFVINSSEEDFRKALKEDSLKLVLIETSSNLYRQGKFTNFSKLRDLGNVLGIEDYNTYFSDIAPK